MSQPNSDTIGKSSSRTNRAEPSRLDLKKHMEELHNDWVAFIGSLTPSVQSASTELAHRIEIQRDVEICDWHDHFSAVTLLYANLHTECTSIGMSVRREANLAQLCALVAAFTEDRVLDRQIQLTSIECIFLESVRSRANAFIQELDGRSFESRTYVERLRKRYAIAMGTDYSWRGKRGLQYSAIRQVAPARGYVGACVPFALALSTGVGTGTIRRMQGAFDRLMLGLQWLDDLVDWREDLECHDVNLMLYLMREQGLDPYSHPSNDLRDANVGHALLERDLLELAAEQSIRWLEFASQMQCELHCPTLGGLIKDRIRTVRAKKKAENRRVESEVYAQLVARGSACSALSSSA